MAVGHGRTVAVTGGAGFIGSHLVERLLSDGWRVVCIDNFEPFYARRLKQRNLAPVVGHPRFRLAVADVRRKGQLRAALQGETVQALVHLAARPGVRQSFLRPLAYLRSNVLGTLNVASLCREMGVERLVLGSSSSVYGAVEGPAHEGVACRPLSPYGASKLAAEAVAAACAADGLSVVALRLFTVYGPRQRPDMALERFASALLKGLPVHLHGDGQVRRDFTYVDDAVEALARALTAPLAGFQAINVGTGCPRAIAELLLLLQEQLGRRSQVIGAPLPEGDPPLTWADIGRARSLLGYAPRVGLEEGVRRYAEWRLRCGHV
ncbi:MAG TPA: NAD-dependent epimerase/dehydratase family protein [Dehalococcoidia bacterium]|nr:NAD-dependent epimerase/dehydratase family protein [Dehalococcoidia bacterium]